MEGPAQTSKGVWRDNGKLWNHGTIWPWLLYREQWCMEDRTDHWMSNYKTHWRLDHSSRYGEKGMRTDLGNVFKWFGTLGKPDVSSERMTSTSGDSGFCLKEFSRWWLTGAEHYYLILLIRSLSGIALTIGQTLRKSLLGGHEKGVLLV